MWDVVVPAVFLKPEIMVDVQERYITVDATPGINSGRAVSWPRHWLNNMETGEGFPEGVNRAFILFSIDAEAFWDFYVELLSDSIVLLKTDTRGIILTILLQAPTGHKKSRLGAFLLDICWILYVIITVAGEALKEFRRYPPPC